MASWIARLGSTRPGPGDVADWECWLHHRRLLLLRAVHEQTTRPGTPAAARAAFACAWSRLERAERASPAAVRELLGYPATGNRLSRLLRVAGGELVAETAEFAELAARHDPATATAAAPALPRLPTARGLLDRVDPHRTPRDAAGRPRWPVATPAEAPAVPWLAQWEQALRWLGAVDPARAAEVRALTRSLVPLRRAPGPGSGTPNSATGRAAPGAVLCVPQPDAPALAALLVHEIQHTKLAILFDVLPLYRPGGAAHHRVAWRLDDRPVQAVLQGTYAHLGLADLWHRVACAAFERPPAGAEDARSGFPGRTVAQSEAHDRCEDYREQVGQALALLHRTAELTPAGVSFVQGMADHHARLGSGVGTVYR
ncbi:HEXXH motif-containing putative peptide modification protein [Streptomyces polyrhachis]|uniref:HEXXH motif-containing putative peptide modification protein n=1 Tax=Streptomyces polyrhachis TaxID=1282885 RepID=A0ABW2GLE1_9ACTN